MESFKDFELGGWNTKARGYDELTGTAPRRQIDPLLESVGAKRGMRLLEVACGTGLLASAAAERGLDVVSVDFARSMVAEARRKHRNVEFQLGDTEGLDFDDASFGIVACLFGLLHLAHSDAAIAQAFRVLKPGGRTKSVECRAQDRGGQSGPSYVKRLGAGVICLCAWMTQAGSTVP